jgi:hydrogenase maturation factor
MCRSTVGRVLAIDGGDAIVTFDGVERRASTLLVPDLVPGDLVLIGLGTVLGRVSASDLDELRSLEAGIHESLPPPDAGGRPTGARP